MIDTELAGNWTLERSENYDDFLKASGKFNPVKKNIYEVQLKA